MTKTEIAQAIAALPTAVNTGWVDSRGEELLRCPVCGNVESFEHMDGGGAYEGCAFCPGCNSELQMPGVTVCGA